jgi:hypothetical protein
MNSCPGIGPLKLQDPDRRVRNGRLRNFRKITVGKRSQARATFRNEQDARAFARARLAEGSNVNAGTLNPHLPKRTITSLEILDWLNEPEG